LNCLKAERKKNKKTQKKEEKKKKSSRRKDTRKEAGDLLERMGKYLLEIRWFKRGFHEDKIKGGIKTIMT